MLTNGLKKVLLNTPGALELAWWWVAREGKKYGVDVHIKGKSVELSKQNHLIRLEPRHVRRAVEVCREFDVYRHILPIEKENDIEVTDFCGKSDQLGWEHYCLKLGVRIESRDGAVWLRKDRRVMILSAKHFIYSTALADRFDLYFDPLVPREQDGLLILDYSQPGVVQRYANSGLEFAMASFPEEEEAIEEYFRWYRPRPGDLVFDMGAHCGVSTYKLSKLVGTAGKVIAFEPDPLNYSILLRNLKRHGLDNVVAVNIAVAGETGELPFNCEGTIGSTLTSLMSRKTVGSTSMVEAVTMNDAFERWGRPVFCKIDIEGAEIEVLTAAEKALTDHPIHLAIDTNHPQADGKMTDHQVEVILRSYGYEVLSEAKPLLTTWARAKTI